MQQPDFYCHVQFILMPKVAVRVSASLLIALKNSDIQVWAKNLNFFNLGPYILNVLCNLNLATTASSHSHAIQHSLNFLLPFSIM